MRTLGRIIWVPIAFLLSAAMAGFVLVTLGLERLTVAMRGAGGDGDSLFWMFDLVGHGVVLASAFTLVPALLVVIVGEVSKIRASLFYVAGGGLSLAVVPLITRFGDGGALTLPSAPVWQVFATAGFAGGAIYWLLAGRNA